MQGVAKVRALIISSFVAATFVLAPAVVSAQSAFSGIVRDTSGAVLPGVTVEASSPVLIEKTRAAVTDGEGRYTITDLRPGTYAVVFTLTGFNTFRRDGLELPTNFNMQINADLRVGSLEESITVTGDAPVVDVQSTQRTQVLNRDLLDALPSARNYSGLAALMPGVRMSNTDVGGNQQMEQIYMTVHGSRQTDTTVQVDGLQLNSLMNDGQVQAYFSDAANAEVSYQTSGVGADVSGGGVRINMIPKEGGNRVSGSAFAGGTNGSWQANNVSHELKAAGSPVGEKVDHISDYNFAIGGPIKQDKLWYFTTLPPHRHQRARREQLLQGRHAGHGGSVDLQRAVPPDLADDAQEQAHGVLRPLSEVQGPRDGRADRSGNGGGAARLAARELLHRPGEVHVDRHQPPAPRGGLLDQRRVPLHRLPAGRAEGPRQRRSGSRTIGKSEVIAPGVGDESRSAGYAYAAWDGRIDAGQRHRSRRST